MKTKMLSKLIAICALVCFFFAPTEAEAQVINPYSLMNNSTCTVTVRLTFYRTSASGCRPCSPPVTVVVPPSPPPTMVPVTPAVCNCGVMVEVIDINGAAVTPPIVAGFNIPPIQPHGNGPDPSGCFSSGMINFDCHPHGVDIHP